jgi:hypothetical protein
MQEQRYVGKLLTLAAATLVLAAAAGLSSRGRSPAQSANMLSTAPLLATVSSAYRLAFTTPARTIVAGGCSQAITVQLQNSSAQAVTLATTLDADIIDTSGYQGLYGSYSDAGCRNALPVDPTLTNGGQAQMLPIPAGQSSASLYISGTVAHVLSLTATSSAVVKEAGPQSFTVNPGPAFSLSIAGPGGDIAPVGSCTPLTVRALDTFGNLTTVPKTSMSGAPNTAYVSIDGIPSRPSQLYSDSLCTKNLPINYGNQPYYNFPVGASTFTVYFKSPVSENQTLIPLFGGGANFEVP